LPAVPGCARLRTEVYCQFAAAPTLVGGLFALPPAVIERARQSLVYRPPS
jgi:hypothetical protein